jgi:hypothetical protein
MTTCLTQQQQELLPQQLTATPLCNVTTSKSKRTHPPVSMTTSFSAAAGLLPSSQLPLPRHLLLFQLLAAASKAEETTAYTKKCAS